MELTFEIFQLDFLEELRDIESTKGNDWNGGEGSKLDGGLQLWLRLLLVLFGDQ